MRGAAPKAATVEVRGSLRRGPAWLDALQSGTGLALSLFMLAHTLFAATILLGVDAMARLARALEGESLFGRPIPGFVSTFVLAVFGAFVVHALLAMRKAPASHAQFVRLRQTMHGLDHADTNLWRIQVVTGFVLLFLATVHLCLVLMNPAELGPLESARQVWGGRMWLLYAVLLPAVELHVGIGLYRLAMKWGWFTGRTARRRLKQAMWVLIAAYVALGFASLAAYARLGMDLERAERGAVLEQRTP